VKSVTEAIKLGMNWVVGSNIGRKEIQNDRQCLENSRKGKYFRGPTIVN